jgi:hypothetical protein
MAYDNAIMTTNNPTNETTNPGLERARNRVHNGAVAVADEIRREARHAAERPGAIVVGQTAEQ